MTLPFEKNTGAEKAVRKYQCFVCGVLFSSFEDYKVHIDDKHEEGKDYVRCPLPHCEAPVRDLRMHFKVKHPGLEMPQKGMAKASVWKDFNSKGDKKVTRKPKFREGWYDSMKMQKSLHYRSGLECSLYECLDSDFDVIGYDVEPFEIPYTHHGKGHNYIPDLIVHFRDGRTEVWEVKPSSQTLLEKNEDKWNAAHHACKMRGWEFVVITEKGIDKLKCKLKGRGV